MDDFTVRDIAAQGAAAGGLGAVGRLLALAHAGASKPTGWSLLWEVPLAIGMGVVGKGVADFLRLDDFPEYAVTIAVSYIGPRVIDILAARYAANRADAAPPAPPGPG